MRNFTLAVLMMIATGIQPLLANGFSTLHLRMQDNSPFMIVMDGRQFGTIGSLQTIDGLTPGNHNLQVLENVLTMNNTRVRTTIYNGNVYFQNPVEVDAMIDYYGQFKVMSQRNIITQANPYLTNYYNYSSNPNDYRSDDRHRAENTYCDTKNTYYAAPCAMDNYSFSALKNTIANQWFDDTKATVAKQAMSRNKFTSQQVRELLPLFSFETTKLDVAKSFYSSVVDKENFFTVFDCFDYSSSIDELSRYIEYQ